MKVARYSLIILGVIGSFSIPVMQSLDNYDPKWTPLGWIFYVALLIGTIWQAPFWIRNWLDKKTKNNGKVGQEKTAQQTDEATDGR